MKKWTIILVSFWAIGASGYTGSEWSVGNHQLFVGMLDSVTTQRTGKPDLIGTHHILPLYFSYAFSFGFDYFFIPTLTTSLLIPRQSFDKATEESLTILQLPMGANFQNGWDWNFGPGIYQSTIKGKGGTYQDPSGSNFFKPSTSASETSQVWILSGGVGKQFGEFRFQSNLMCSGCFNGEKRTLTLGLMLGYVGGGF